MENISDENFEIFYAKGLESFVYESIDIATSKIPVKLDSMNSYERRIVHNILTNNKKVYTESEGEEPNRCVVIKPKED